MVVSKLKLVRNHIIIAFFISILAFQPASAGYNGLVINWQKTIAAKGLSPNPNAVLCNDRELIIVGENYSDETYGYWIAKYDLSGRQIFKKEYHVEGGLSDFNIRSIINDDNGKFIVVGSEFSHGYNLWLRKFDETGTQLFKRTYTFSKSISPGSIMRSEDGNYIVTGTEEFKDVFMMKIDNQGKRNWKETYETESVESIALSTNMSNKNILTVSVTGELDKFGTGKSNIKIATYDSQGQRIRDMKFPGRIVGQPGAVTSDNKNKTFYLSYDSSVIPKGNVCAPTNIGENVIYLMKFNSDLETIWNISIGTKMGLIPPPIINRLGDTLILAGRGNLTMKGIEPPWVYLFDLDGHKVGELLLNNHLDFTPNSIVVDENSIFLIGTEMPMGENDDSKVIIFNIGLKTSTK